MRWRFLLVCFVAACSHAPSSSQAYSTAWTEFREGKLQQAQQTVDASLKRYARDLSSKEFEPLRLLQTEILLARGQPRNAFGLLNQLPDPQDPVLHLRWMVDRADALSRLGQADKAKGLLDDVDRIAGSNGTGDWAFKSLLLRGAMLANAGDVDEAEEVLKKLLVRTKEAGDDYNQASALLNLSFSKLKRNRVDESIKYSGPGLELAEKIHAGRIAAIANDNLGVAYTALHDLDRAVEHQNRAVTQLREIDDLRSLEDSLGGLGNIYLLAHKPALAAQAFEQAVAIAKRADATLDVLRWTHRLAFAMIEQQNWDAADSWNQQASAMRQQLKDPGKEPFIELNQAAIANGRGNSQEAERLYRDLSSGSKGVPYIEWDAHMRLGSLLANEHKLTEAYAEYERGLTAIEGVQSSLIQDDYRLSYHDLQMEFFKDYVELLVSKGRKDRALQVAEYSRARVLAERLGVQPGAINEIRLPDFQSYARKTGTVLLSFWLAPKRSFVWVIKPEGIQLRELPSRNDLADLIRGYQKTIEDQRDPVELRLPLGERLSNALLGPLHGDLIGAKRVVIVPDEEIHGLNLETLPVADGSRYWIDDVEIAIAPSLTLLAQDPPKSRAKPSLLLIGAPVAEDKAFPELPSANTEIDLIHRRFEDARVRRGAEATPRGFLDAMPGEFSMIHFAAHAETNSQSPLESAVILSKSGDTYKLYARDVAQLNLSADLVTISACRSAGGRAYGGEGLVGFAWAFLHSGARAVIAGLWDVGDDSSSRLMDSLYESLAAHSTPATALRSAKRTLLHSTGAYRKPFYWAPYQIYIR